MQSSPHTDSTLKKTRKKSRQATLHRLVGLQNPQPIFPHVNHANRSQSCCLCFKSSSLVENREGVATATFKSQETSIAIFPKLMELLVSSLGVRVSSRKSSFSADSKWPAAPTTRRSIPYLLPHLGEKNHERTPPISSGKGRKSDALEAVGVPLWPVCLGVCLLFMVARTNEQPPFILAFGLFLVPLGALASSFGYASKFSREWRVGQMQGNSGSRNYIRWNNLPEQSDILLVRLFWGREFRYILQSYLKSLSFKILILKMY